MARLYVILVLTLFGIFAVVYAIKKPYTIHHSFFDRPEGESHNIATTWSDYLEKCSGEQIIDNQVHALHQFT